jgi:hypothetical protein
VPHCGFRVRGVFFFFLNRSYLKFKPSIRHTAETIHTLRTLHRPPPNIRTMVYCVLALLGCEVGDGEYFLNTFSLKFFFFFLIICTDDDPKIITDLERPALSWPRARGALAALAHSGVRSVSPMRKQRQQTPVSPRGRTPELRVKPLLLMIISKNAFSSDSVNSLSLTFSLSPTHAHTQH